MGKMERFARYKFMRWSCCQTHSEAGMISTSRKQVHPESSFDVGAIERLDDLVQLPVIVTVSMLVLGMLSERVEGPEPSTTLVKTAGIKPVGVLADYFRHPRLFR